MPKFFNEIMAGLAHQLALSPRRLRVAQLQNIDKLLGIVEPDRSYPFELVCFKITGYRRRGTEVSTTLSGKSLIVDLATVAEVISRQANVHVRELAEPFQSHADLAHELRVSTKTIRRWRNRGLVGIRVTFEDGVNRLVFCRQTVERFVARHKALVDRGTAFRQLTVSERNQIVERARLILAGRKVKLHAAARQIASETGRAVETVRYTLRRFDESHPDVPLFAGESECGPGEKLLAMWRCREKGESVSSIAAAFETTPADVERELRAMEVYRWTKSPLEFVYNELFDAPEADEIILHQPEPAGEEVSPVRPPRDLPPYLRTLYTTPLLTRAQEQDLFRRYNYLKFKAARRLKSVDPGSLSDGLYEALRALMSEVEELRQRIVRANLRLVVSIAKRHVGHSENFFEVVSDGNMSLLRAVEKFDYSLGNKFSTYASWAIMKNYARTIPEQHYRAARFVTGQELALDQAADHRGPTAPDPDDGTVRRLLDQGLEFLSERERTVVAGHYGLDDGGTPQTLEQIGRVLGVTKERVRQIERKALARLHELLSPSLAQSLGG